MSAVAAWFRVEQNRAYLYRVACALSPLLVAAGLLTDGTAQVVLGALGVVLALGVPALAAKNTSTKG